MDNRASGPTTVPRSYEDFDPHFEWVRDKDSDTLRLQLPGFRRAQVRVQVDTYGNLRTSGRRPLGGNRWLRFWKDFRIPENCNVDDIRAKFENEVLHVILPKQVIARPPPEAAAEPKPSGARAPREPEAAAKKQTNGGEDWHSAEEEEKDRRPKAADEEKTADAGGDGGGAASGPEAAEYGVGALAPRKSRRTLLLNVAVAVLVLVGLGMYATYQLRKAAGLEPEE